MLRRAPYHWTTKPPLGSRLNPAHPLCQSLTAYYLLNEGSGNVAWDLTGQYPATSTAGSWTADASGTALNIAGTSSHCPITSTFAIGSVPVTIIGWATSTTANPASKSPFDFHSTQNQLGMLTSVGGAAEALYLNTVAVVGNAVDTNLHMYAVTNTCATGGLILYQDGHAVASGTKALTSLGSGSLYIGEAFTNGDIWPGSVSQLMLWSGRALDANSIAQLYADRYCMIAPPPSRR